MSTITRHLADPLNLVDVGLFVAWGLFFNITQESLSFRTTFRSLIGFGLSVLGLFHFPTLLFALKVIRSFQMMRFVLRCWAARQNGDETIEEEWFYQVGFQNLIFADLLCNGTPHLLKFYFGLLIVYDFPILKFNEGSQQQRTLLAIIALGTSLMFSLPFLWLLLSSAPPVTKIVLPLSYGLSLIINTVKVKRLLWRKKFVLL